MTIKVAINGFGRIGRNVLRAHYECNKKHGNGTILIAGCLRCISNTIAMHSGMWVAHISG